MAADDASKDTTANDTVSKADYDKLQSKVDHWMSKATDYEKRFKGIDPDQVPLLKEENEALKRERAEKDPKRFDEWAANKEKEIEGRYSKRYGDLEGELSTTRTRLKELEVVDAVMKEATPLFNDDALPIIRKLVREECDHDGERVIIKGDDGKAMRSRVDPRRDMDVAEYVRSLAEQYPSLARPQGSGGAKPSGSKQSTGGAAGNAGEVSVEQYRKMSAEDRRAKLTPAQRLKLSQASLSQR